MTGTGVTCIINVGNKKAFLDACEKGYRFSSLSLVGQMVNDE